MIPGLPPNLHFDWPWVFLLLVLIPPVLWLSSRRTHRMAASLPLPIGDAEGHQVVVPKSWRVRLLPLGGLIRALALIALIIALARPQLGEGRVITSTDAVAIQVVVDRSGSMAQEMELDGATMNRLDAVKRVLREFVLGDGKSLPGRPADLIGLISFARFAETSCPLVRDPKSLVQLAEAVPLAQQRYEDGTAVGDALALAAARLQRAEEDLRNRTTDDQFKDLRIKSKLIILLTDGDNNAGERDPLESATLASEWGIRVYTIGIGAGAPSYQTIRTPFGGEQRVRVPSNVDEEALTAIAETTGGVYRRAQDGDALRKIYAEIDTLEKSNVRTFEYTDYAERFTPFALAAAGLLALQTLLNCTILRRTVG